MRSPHFIENDSPALATTRTPPELELSGYNPCRIRVHSAAVTRARNKVEEIYVSTDVEADGPIPGPHSMLSFASAAFTADKTLVGTFTRNLEALPGAAPDPRTEAWWKTQPEAWEACRRDPVPPSAAMRDYVAWLDTLPAKPVFVGYPAAYDFLFVYWYLRRFAGDSPFSHSALDIKTFAMCLLGTDYRATTKATMPRRWFAEAPHTHVALDDALEQGALFCNMLLESKAKPR